MADAQLSTIRRYDQQTHIGVVRLHGRFRFNGASAPTSVIGNWVSSVAHTATGVWTVTLAQRFRKWRGPLSAHVSLELDAAALTFLQLGALDEAAGTVIVRAFTESAGTLAAADIAAGSNDGNWCHLTLVLKYSTTGDGSGIT